MDVEGGGEYVLISILEHEPQEVLLGLKTSGLSEWRVVQRCETFRLVERERQPFVELHASLIMMKLKT